MKKAGTNGHRFNLSNQKKSTRKARVPKTRALSVHLSAKNIPANVVRILLVEDHEPTRVSLAMILSRRKYQVTSAASLSEARALAKKEKFSIVISDIGLPDGNGCDLMQELRQRLHLKGIALTGYGTERDVNRSFAAGFMAHLTKPVRIESLDNALSVALQEAA